MRLAAIYCVWGDRELLKRSVENIRKVDAQTIIVFSRYSNFGVEDTNTNWTGDWGIEGSSNHLWNPDPKKQVHENECTKRNVGLNLAKLLGATHFIMLDADEFYEPEAFKIEKDYIEKNDIAGTVCKTRVYFKKPTLYVHDHTLVPFIHKLTPSLQFQLNNKTYPFAYDKEGNAHIDPTRRLNISSGVEWSNITMHHFSWLRSDYNLKIENSAARNNLKRSTIYADLEKAAPGVYNDFYRAELKECENIFNLPEL